MKRICIVFSLILTIVLCFALAACGEKLTTPADSNSNASTNNYGGDGSTTSNHSSTTNLDVGKGINGGDNSNDTTIAVSAITLNQRTLTLDVDAEETLSISISPANATDKSVIWSSSNTSIASVSNGTITAINVGNCVITAKSANGKTASCSVTVKRSEFVFSEYSYGYAMTAYTGTSTNVVVPSSYKGQPVLAIGLITNGNGSLGAEGGFYGNSTMTTVQLPNSIVQINQDAFAMCTKLKSVTVPESCTRILAEAFLGCTSLESLYLPSNCIYSNYILPGCVNLKTLTLPGENANMLQALFYSSSNSPKNRLSVTINGGWDIGNWKEVEVLKELTIDSSGITSIEKNILPDTLESLTIKNGVPNIDSNAFYECRALTSVNLGNSVISIGDSAFSNCRGIRTVSIGKGVTYFGRYAFSYCTGLTSVTISKGVTSIGSCAFYGCRGLTSITIPNSVTSIGDSAFSNCSGLTSITIPDSVTSIGSCAFYDCSGLTSVTIPDGVTSIENQTFSYCGGLTSITIPSSVIRIFDDVFHGCHGLTTVNYLGNKTQWASIYKRSKWNEQSGNFTIRCTDGIIAKSKA